MCGWYDYVTHLLISATLNTVMCCSLIKDCSLDVLIKLFSCVVLFHHGRNFWRVFPFFLVLNVFETSVCFSCSLPCCLSEVQYCIYSEQKSFLYPHSVGYNRIYSIKLAINIFLSYFIIGAQNYVKICRLQTGLWMQKVTGISWAVNLSLLESAHSRPLFLVDDFDFDPSSSLSRSNCNIVFRMWVGLLVSLCVQHYKSVRAALTIYVTMVNIQTHTHILTHSDHLIS